MPVLEKWFQLRTFQDPQLERLLRQTAEYVLAFQAGHAPAWLTLMGVSETGKTHTARRVWRHLAAKSQWTRAAYVHGEIFWPQFVEELRASAGGEGNAHLRLLDMASRWPVLFLDDIGAELDKTGFASEKLNMLLGARVGRWTILTSNLGLGDLEKLDTRIASRIVREPGNRFIELDTVPYTLRSRGAQQPSTTNGL
jgi:DNA replication protein DnaC